MDAFFGLETITIKLEVYGEDKEIICSVMDYATAKVKELREFGYTDLTEKSVQESVWRIVKGEKHKDIIDKFIVDDIVLPEEEPNPMCKKYPDSEAIPNEDDKCSLCGGDCVDS